MVGMGLPFAQRRFDEAGEALVTRAMAALAVLVAALAACNSDDEAEPDTTPPPTTAAATTEPTDPPTTPESTAAPTTTDSPTTTQAPTTTVDVEALKAQIAADYERSWELFDELVTNPTLEGLDEQLAFISAPGTENFANKRAFVEELVSTGDRVVNGQPDYSTDEVEIVELLGTPPYTSARVTFCSVSNRQRIAPDGAVLISGLTAARRSETVVLTPNGWLPDATGVETWGGLEVTECAPQ